MEAGLLSLPSFLPTFILHYRVFWGVDKRPKKVALMGTIRLYHFSLEYGILIS